MKTKSKFAPEVMCVVAVRNGVLYTIRHGKKIRTYSGCTPTIRSNGYKTITGKNLANQLMDHFIKSDDFVNTTVGGLRSCFVLNEDQFAAQPTRKTLSIRQIMAKAD